jgi:hypothetical protein
MLYLESINHTISIQSFLVLLSGLKITRKIQQTFDYFVSNVPPICLQYQVPGLPPLQLFLCCDGKKMAYNKYQGLP